MAILHPVPKYIEINLILLHYTSVFLFRPLYNLNHCLQMLVQLLWEYWISSFIPLYKLIRNIQSRNQNSITSALICLLKRKKRRRPRNCKHTLVKLTLPKTIWYPKQISLINVKFKWLHSLCFSIEFMANLFIFSCIFTSQVSESLIISFFASHLVSDSLFSSDEMRVTNRTVGQWGCFSCGMARIGSLMS